MVIFARRHKNLFSTKLNFRAEMIGIGNCFFIKKIAKWSLNE